MQPCRNTSDTATATSANENPMQTPSQTSLFIHLFSLVVAKDGKRDLSGRQAWPTFDCQPTNLPQADLASLMPEVRAGRHQVRGYPIHQLAKVLFPGRPVKPTVLNKWIAAGLLKTRAVGRARIVFPEEVEQFRSDYCLADEACRLLDISRSTLSRWEVEGRVRPVYGKRVTPSAGFSLYRREDLTKISRRRNSRRSN